MKNTILLLLSFLLLGTACKVNPVTGKKDFLVMGTEREKALGASYDPQVEASMGFYDDAKLQRFIDEKGQQMARISHRPNLGFQFKIVDSPVVNAFAVPGGYVYFTRGIMAHFNNEAEFAGVLGHEIGHVTARHSAKQMRNQTLSQVGLIAGAIAFPRQFGQFGEMAQQGLGLLLLKNGRDDESQSDKLGVQYSTKVGYDAVEMANFFRTIDRISAGSGQEIPTFLSTHPDPLDREEKVKQMARKRQAKAPAGQQFQVNRDSYLRMIDGLLYGKDPKQGFIENNNFYHPVLEFQFPIPNGWQTANSPQQFQMGAPDGKAVAFLMLAQEGSLQEAARAALTNNQLTLKQQENIRVNGMNAIAMRSAKPNELEVLTYVIQDGNRIYKLHGLSTPQDFSRYFNTFKQIFDNFDKLTDPSKLNKQPERVKIETVKSNTTLQNALTGFGMPRARLNELAILNGMELNDRVTAGMLIKTVR